MSLFAEHSPKPAGAASVAGLTTREARESDLPALGRITSEREGGEADHHRSGLERLLRETVPSGDGLVLVGEVDGEVVGLGKVVRFRHEGTSVADVAPEGWYLAGVVVRPEWRRRGVGDRLTSARLEWIARRATRAYYFVNARNTVSIDLHRRFGFVEITRRFTFPGASFVGGEGILFEAGIDR
jgi:ribosomal protein S18 acetylase RimI-like enzyme